MEASSSSVMAVIITVILLAAFLIALIQTVNHSIGRRTYASGNLVIIDLIVGIMYLVICGGAALLYIRSGYDMSVIAVVLGFGVLVMFAAMIWYCIVHRDTMRLLWTILFAAYFALILYLTVLMRIEGEMWDDSVLTVPFADFTEAFRTGDPALLRHTWMNIALFIPFGYLIPAMNPRYLYKWSFAMIGGLILSTLIEGIQLVFSLGQCDIDDIIANTFGAVLGYLLFRLVWHFNKSWKL